MSLNQLHIAVHHANLKNPLILLQCKQKNLTRKNINIW